MVQHWISRATIPKRDPIWSWNRWDSEYFWAEWSPLLHWAFVGSSLESVHVICWWWQQPGCHQLCKQYTFQQAPAAGDISGMCLTLIRYTLKDKHLFECDKKKKIQISKVSPHSISKWYSFSSHPLWIIFPPPDLQVSSLDNTQLSYMAPSLCVDGTSTQLLVQSFNQRPSVELSGHRSLLHYQSVSENGSTTSKYTENEETIIELEARSLGQDFSPQTNMKQNYQR